MGSNMALFLHFWGQKGRFKSTPVIFRHSFLQAKTVIRALILTVVKTHVQRY